MIAKANLLQILAAADKADADDVAIRAALYIALRCIEDDFAVFTRRDALSVRTPCDARRPSLLISRSSAHGKRRSHCPRFR
jgi:hypothetical protein